LADQSARTSWINVLSVFLLFLECLGGTARLIEPGGSEGGTLTQQHDEGIARKNQPMGDPEIRKTAAEMPSAGTCFSVSGFVRAAASKAADARRYLRSVGAGAARLSESSSIPRGKHARSPTSGPATMKNIGEKPPVYLVEKSPGTNATGGGSTSLRSATTACSIPSRATTYLLATGAASIAVVDRGGAASIHTGKSRAAPSRPDGGFTVLSGKT
jgi:hypothetical protein